MYPFLIAYTGISNKDKKMYTENEMCVFSSTFELSTPKPILITYLKIKIEN